MNCCQIKRKRFSNRIQNRKQSVFDGKISLIIITCHSAGYYYRFDNIAFHSSIFLIRIKIEVAVCVTTNYVWCSGSVYGLWLKSLNYYLFNYYGMCRVLDLVCLHLLFVIEDKRNHFFVDKLIILSVVLSDSMDSLHVFSHSITTHWALNMTHFFGWPLLLLFFFLGSKICRQCPIRWNCWWRYKWILATLLKNQQIIVLFRLLPSLASANCNALQNNIQTFCVVFFFCAFSLFLISISILYSVQFQISVRSMIYAD